MVGTDVAGVPAVARADVEGCARYIVGVVEVLGAGLAVGIGVGHGSRGRHLVPP